MGWRAVYSLSLSLSVSLKARKPLTFTSEKPDTRNKKAVSPSNKVVRCPIIVRKEAEVAIAMGEKRSLYWNKGHKKKY